jgi:hypothetical protein
MRPRPEADNSDETQGHAGDDERRVPDDGDLRMHVHPLSRLGAGVAVALAVVAGGAAAVSAHEAHGHPVKLHEGSCADIGRVVTTFDGVGGTEDQQGNQVEQPETVNADVAYQVMRSRTVADLDIDAALAAPHALMVYQSDEDLTGIACGNLGGARFADELVVALGEVNVPGHVGFAVFREGGDGTEVTVYVGHALSPVSASGGAAGDRAHGDDGDRHAEGSADDHDHDHDQGHDGEATPAGDA